MFVTFYVISCNSSGFMKLVTQLHGLCTSAAVGVGACCLGIGFRHMFHAFEWRGGAWAVRLISFPLTASAFARISGSRR